MTDSVNYGGLTVAKELDDFLRNEVVDGIAVDPDQFWSALESVLKEFGPRNTELLATRESLQMQIDQWHIER